MNYESITQENLDRCHAQGKRTAFQKLNYVFFVIVFISRGVDSPRGAFILLRHSPGQQAVSILPEDTES